MRPFMEEVYDVRLLEQRFEIAAAVVCVTIVERLKEDQVTYRSISPEEAQLRLQNVVIAFIKQKLNWKSQ